MAGYSSGHDRGGKRPADHGEDLAPPRLFCKGCDKLRITPAGMLKTCLYDNGALDLRELVLSAAGDRVIGAAIAACVNRRFANGHEPERACRRATEPSMSVIGG
ncbi:MAG: hypothetical protein P1P81_09825 [Desulfobulbales bacterium]|nr:hypothetical protein [Desulfobulbales bacterium]